MWEINELSRVGRIRVGACAPYVDLGCGRNYVRPQGHRIVTIADVFIVESLAPEDEAANRFEGQRLADILRLAGKQPHYYYFRGKDELANLLELFKKSDYRFLHMSCHASLDAIATTTEQIPYPEFARICAGYLPLRRAFFSACELGNELFSTCLAGTNKGMHSIVAPAENIFFDHAAAIWSAFYVSVFSNNAGKMTGADIRQRIETLCTLFPVDFHVSTYHPALDTWYHNLIKKGQVKGAGNGPKGIEQAPDAEV